MEIAAPLMRVHVKTLAGAQISLQVPIDASVLDLKHALLALHPSFAVGRQRLAIMTPELDGHEPWLVLLNRRSLASYGVENESELNLVLADEAPTLPPFSEVCCFDQYHVSDDSAVAR